MSGGVTLPKVSEWNGRILISSFLCFVGHTVSPFPYGFLVHITDSNCDDRWHWFRQKQAREDERDREGKRMKFEEFGRKQHEVFQHRFSCRLLLNTRASVSVHSYSLRKWNSGLCNQPQIPVIELLTNMSGGSVTSFTHKHRRHGLQLGAN